MISPTNRLLMFTGCIAVPFAAIGVMLPEYGLASALALAAFVCLAIMDAVAATGTQDGIRVVLPEVVRMSKDRESEIAITLHNEQQRSRVLRLGLPWPREFVAEGEDLLTTLPTESSQALTGWNCTPLKRGNYRLRECFRETASPAGLWNYRTRQELASELRVYPNLMTERRNVAALFLNRGAFGVHAQRLVGQGRDFEKLREYIPGDSYEEIHWKATAKRGKPVTKIFQMERTQEVYVVLDCSRLTAREVQLSDGGGMVSTLERFITASLILGLAAERQGDLFGLMTFSDRVLSFVRAKNGKAHYAHCRDALYTLHPQSVSPDFEEMATFIRLRLRRRALVIFLTALDDPVLAEQFTRGMDLLSRQHLIMVNMLPSPGIKPLFSGDSAESVSDIYQNLGGHMLWQNLRELEKVLQRRGVKFSLLENERMSAQLVTQYLNVKRRQLI